MASISATLLVPVSRAVKFQSQQNRNCKLSSSTTINFTGSSSSSRRPSRAVLSSSTVDTREAGTGNSSLTLHEICQGHVPEHVLRRQDRRNWILFTDGDTAGRSSGSGKTLTYLLLIFSIINTQRSAMQALIVVPTRELGMQVTKVARMLAAKPTETDLEQKCTVMALLDGGMLRRHRSWLKAEPPTIVVATIGSLCHLIEKHVFKLDCMRVLVIDEVDFLFNSSKQVSFLKKLLASYSSCNNRQTVFASASIPQHRRFLHDCIQQKWTKSDVIHVHVNSIQPLPLCLHHRFVNGVAVFNGQICSKETKQQTLLSLLQSDTPESGIIFVGEQSEKSKKAGNAPSTTLLIDILKTSYGGSSEILLLEEDMNFNSRAASLLEVRQGGGYLLVSTDIAARGIDLPETTHIYNFDLPRTAVDYLHRAGRTGRKPFSDEKCTVTNIITSEEQFVLQRYENELKFNCEELTFQVQC
ncbi:hypothetical protein EZV62_000563 [Acer yangbiense]|uniref:RNA helicase n=1 Tax=Acer yangbiense TaxID=1000413 RepID=A0A5C7IT25_9ROSI|nr:hypothetical protein EZV62_000563 [Acer yangbiense]